MPNSTSAAHSSSSNTNASQGAGNSNANHQPSLTIQNIVKNPFVSVQDILSHKLTMFNFKLPNDRNMYESSLIYCNTCDYSCDLSDKSAIICHFVSKHPQENIVYSYLWPQMELNQLTNQFKIKYYLIKAHLKIRTKENSGAQIKSAVEFPNTILTEEEKQDQEETIDEQETNDLNVKFVVDKILDWLEKSSTEQQSPSSSQVIPPTLVNHDEVQELEEEQEVQEVEMTGEETFDPSQFIPTLDSNNQDIQQQQSLYELLKMTSSTLYYKNQQKITSSNLHLVPSNINSYSISNASNNINLQLDNNFLVHLLAINKSENVFRVKQIHDYYGGCFICGKQVEFNMKHYQVSYK
jgi:hypothetical protein